MHTYYLNNKYILTATLLLFLCFTIVHLYTYLSNELFLITSNDRYYYLALAASFNKYDLFINIIHYPYKEALNYQLGTPLIYYLLLTIFDNNSNILTSSTIISTILFISTLYPIFKLVKLSGIPLVFIPVILLPYIFFQEYFEYIVNGITEGYFYPIVIWWLYFAIKWRSNSNYFWTSILLIASFLAISIRVQSLLIFFSFIITLFICNDFKKCTIFSIAIISITIFYYLTSSFLIFEFENSSSKPVELKVLQNVFDLSFSNIKSLTPIFHLFFFNLGAAGPLSEILKWIISHPFWIIIIGYPVYIYFLPKTEPPPVVIIFSVITIAITLIAFFAAGGYKVNLRYIYYILPFVLFVLSWIIYLTYNNNYKILNAYLIIGFATLVLFNFRIFYMYNINQSYEGFENRKAAVDRYYEQSDLFENYLPEKTFTKRNPVRHSRYFYFLTGQTSYQLSEFEPTDLNEDEVYWFYLPTQSQFVKNNYQDLIYSEYHFDNDRSIYVLKK